LRIRSGRLLGHARILRYKVSLSSQSDLRPS
jgi:hypothetical protein